MVERRLQISLVAAATTAAVMLGVAQDNPIVVLIGLFTGITSIVFTDINKWLVLDRRISYIAMIAAAAISLNGFWRNTSEAQLLAIANMLVFVQIALLYQEKTLRVYSHLAVFSVLQVVVAALLNVGPMFLVLLAFYSISGSYAVMMYAMHRENLRLERLQELSNTEVAESPPAAWETALGGRIQCQPRLSPKEASSLVFATGRWMQLVPMLLSVLTFAAFFFVFSPRIGSGGWQSRGAAGIVGFSEEVSFRDIGRMIESNAWVMKVTFTDVGTNQNYKLYNEPYFRGAALATYEFGKPDPVWKVSNRVAAALGDLPPLQTNSELADLVRQEIDLSPSRQSTLFGVTPYYNDIDTPRWVKYTPTHNKLKVDQMDLVDGYQTWRYSLRTTGFQAGAQAQITRQHYKSQAESVRREIETVYTTFRPESCPTIQRVATEQLQGQTEEGRIFQCQLLMRYLLSEDFTYSLDTSKIREMSDPAIDDPVEDFFANHKTGYCGHFASALALMLRSQGIPARVVVGYKGGEYNEMGNFYVVRSRDAHAWVEAYLRPEDISGISDAKDRDIDSAAGAWLRLDPTPGSNEDDLNRGAMAYVDQVLDYSRSLWSDYVLGAASQNAMDSGAVSSVSRRRRRETIRDMVKDALPSWVWAALGAAPIIAIVMAAVWAIIRNFPVIARWRQQRKKAQRRTISSVEFYNRLEKIAASRQLWRRDHETPREFAGVIARRMRELDAENGDEPNAISALEQIVQAFYETRFGGRPLDSIETDAIEQALRQVDEALAVQPT